MKNMVGIRILIPVDVDNYSLSVLKTAMALASNFNTEIKLLYAYSHLVTQNKFNSTSSDIKKEVRSPEEAFSRLRLIQQKALVLMQEAKHDRISIKYELKEGYTEDVILDVSNTYQPHLIILGSQCKDGTVKELLGCVSYDIIEQAHAPVLVLPNGMGIDFSGQNKVAYLSDFKSKDFHSIHQLFRLIMMYDTEVNVIKIVEGNPSNKDVAEIKDFGRYCKTTYRNQTLTCEFLVTSNVIEGITNYVEKNNIAVLAIKKRKDKGLIKLFRNSKSKKMLFHVEIPLLIFHE
ncbi:universal stress protein [bacterium]|nr:universal stress protein [bacterium]